MIFSWSFASSAAVFDIWSTVFKFAFPGKFLQNNRNVRDLLPILTNLPICNLFFAILCNLFFVNIVDLFFLIFFGKIFLPDIFATYFFAIPCNLFLANLLELFFWQIM